MVTRNEDRQVLVMENFKGGEGRVVNRVILPAEGMYGKGRIFNAVSYTHLDVYKRQVKYHISGQLKVAPEHCIDSVLDYMGKPHIDVYERFMEKYRSLNARYDKEQYVVPYLMSSHPGSTLESAIAPVSYTHLTSPLSAGAYTVAPVQRTPRSRAARQSSGAGRPSKAGLRAQRRPRARPR